MGFPAQGPGQPRRRLRPGRGRVPACALWLVPAAMLCAETPAAPEQALRLRHRFEPGQECVFEFTSVLTQDMQASAGQQTHDEMKLAGRVRQTVAEVEAPSGNALIGWLGHGRWEITTGAERTPDTARDQTWIAAYRLAPDGRSVRRTSKRLDSRQHLLQRAINQISEGSQVCAAFPAEAVTPGHTWEGDVLLPMPGTRQAGRAVSTLAEVRGDADGRYAVIRSRLSAAPERSHVTWRADIRRPDMAVEGSSEGLFDVERGLWRHLQVNLQARLEGPGFQGTMRVVSTMTLLESRRLPSAEAAARAARIRALDEALACLYADNFVGGIAQLERQAGSEEADWRRGIELTLALVRPLEHPHAEADVGAGPPAPAVTPAAEAALEIYKQAAGHAEAGEPEAAAAAYRRFLALTNAAVPAATRLLAQYRLAGLLDKLGRRAEARGAYEAVQVMEADDDYSRQLQRKAREKAEQLAAGPAETPAPSPAD